MCAKIYRSMGDYALEYARRRESWIFSRLKNTKFDLKVRLMPSTFFSCKFPAYICMMTYMCHHILFFIKMCHDVSILFLWLDPQYFFGVSRYSNQSLQSSFLRWICPHTSEVIRFDKACACLFMCLVWKNIRIPIIQNNGKKTRRGDYQYEEKQPLSSTGFKKHVLENFQIIGVQMCWETKKNAANHVLEYLAIFQQKVALNIRIYV